MKTLVVAPTRREASALSTVCEAFVSGAGEAAELAVQAQLAANRYDLVVLTGFCGALDPSLGAGALILGRTALMEGGEPLTPNIGILDQMRHALQKNKTPFISSQLLTVARPAATKRAKTNLWNRYGAGGVDMEAYHIARACAAASVPWVVVRAVLDPAHRTLPAAVRDWHDDRDEAAIRRAALGHPQDWPAYTLLAWELRKATEALRRAFPTALAAAEEGWHTASIDLAVMA